jgi:hypothetical protein
VGSLRQIFMLAPYGTAHTGDVRRLIRSAGNLCLIGTRLLVWLILNECVQPSLIAGVGPYGRSIVSVSRQPSLY